MWCRIDKLVTRKLYECPVAPALADEPGQTSNPSRQKPPGRLDKLINRP